MAPRKKKQVEVESQITDSKKEVVTDEELQTTEKQTNFIGSKGTIEKASQKIKDNSPIIIIKMINDKGEYFTQQFTCSQLTLNQDKTTSVRGATKHTTLNLSIDATVIEVM